MPIPPLSEQIEIAAHVASTLGKLVESIEKVAKEVGMVGEFRSRLIADVVTGRLDVREAAAGIPALDPLAAEEDVVTGKRDVGEAAARLAEVAPLGVEGGPDEVECDVGSERAGRRRAADGAGPLP